MGINFLNGLQYFILLLCVMLLILPYGYSYYVGEYESHWEMIFVFEEVLFLLPACSLLVGWLLYFRLAPKSNTRVLLTVILLLCSFLFLMFALVSIVGFTLDYTPAIGTLSMLLLFPAIVLFFLLQRKKAKSS